MWENTKKGDLIFAVDFAWLDNEPRLTTHEVVSEGKARLRHRSPDGHGYMVLDKEILVRRVLHRNDPLWAPTKKKAYALALARWVKREKREQKALEQAQAKGSALRTWLALNRGKGGGDDH